MVIGSRFGLGKHIQDQTNHGLTIVLKVNGPLLLRYIIGFDGNS